jgi:hypothetical protein
MIERLILSKTLGLFELSSGFYFLLRWIQFSFLILFYFYPLYFFLLIYFFTFHFNLRKTSDSFPLQIKFTEHQ